MRHMKQVTREYIIRSDNKSMCAQIPHFDKKGNPHPIKRTVNAFVEDKIKTGH